MDWSDPISDGLLARRADEPPTLRQDIVDELTDHLACALEHERRRTGDEDLARKAVLERFGDPAKLTRRLWWAAMKEVVMRERIILIVVIVLALACIATAAFSMLMLRQGQRVNEAILAKLESIAGQQSSPAMPGDWTKVRFQVTDERDGKPVEGLKVTVKGEPFHTGKEESFSGNTDEHGIVTLGPFRPGSYSYQVWTGRYSKNAPFVLYPSRQTDISLVTPLYEEAGVSISLNWPADLRDKGLLCRFQIALSHNLKSEFWSAGHSMLAVTPDGQIATGEEISRSSVSWRQEAVSESHIELTDQITLPAVTSPGIRIGTMRMIAVEKIPDRPGFVSWTGYPKGIREFYGLPALPMPETQLSEIRSDRKNHWDIELPAETWELVRKWLAALESAKQEQTVPEQ